MSVARSFSQIPVRTKFFITTAAYGGGVGQQIDYEDSTLSFPNGYPGSIVLTGTTGPQSFVYPAVEQGKILKDMGRSMTIVDSTGAHLAVFREVQRVNAADTEGVGPADTDDAAYGTFFIKTWSADGNGVIVARLG